MLSTASRDKTSVCFWLVSEHPGGLTAVVARFVLQISSIRSRCKHPQAWRRGGTLPIWVRAPRRPLAHVSVPFNVSAVRNKHTHVCASGNNRIPKNVGSLAVFACTQRLCCSIISFGFQILCFHVLPATHSSFLSSPVSLWAPSLHPPSSRLYCFLCLSHTPFSLFNSLFQSKYYLTSSQRLSTSQQLFFFFFPLQPFSDPSPLAVFSSLQWGEPLSCIFQQNEPTGFICM